MKPTIIIFLISMCAILCAENLIIYKVSTPPTIDARPSDWGGNWIEIKKSNPSSSTHDLKGRFKMSYDLDNLYIIVEITDTTPNFDSIMIPNTYERDCNELWICMDTITNSEENGHPRGSFHEGGWELRKLRMPEQGGIEGSSFKVGGGWNWNILPLLTNENFKAISSGVGNPYYIEWQIPWDSLTYQLGKDTILAWDKKTLKFEILISDNTTGERGGNTQLIYWSDYQHLNYLPLSYMLGFITLSDGVYVSKTIDDRKINVYPIPLSNLSTIEIPENSYCQLEVKDIFGRQVKLLNIQNQNSIVFSRAGMLSGLYFLRLLGKQKSSETHKIIIN